MSQEPNKRAKPVEETNNKARLIQKQAEGLPSADRGWTRLIVDRSRVKEVVLYTMGQLHELGAGCRVLLPPLPLNNGKSTSSSAIHST